MQLILTLNGAIECLLGVKVCFIGCNFAYVSVRQQVNHSFTEHETTPQI